VGIALCGQADGQKRDNGIGAASAMVVLMLLMVLTVAVLLMMMVDGGYWVCEQMALVGGAKNPPFLDWCLATGCDIESLPHRDLSLTEEVGELVAGLE